MYVCIYIYIYACVCMHIYIYIYKYHSHIIFSMYAYKYVCMILDADKCMPMLYDSVCIRYIYIHAHIYIHTFRVITSEAYRKGGYWDPSNELPGTIVDIRMSYIHMPVISCAIDQVCHTSRLNSRHLTPYSASLAHEASRNCSLWPACYFHVSGWRERMHRGVGCRYRSYCSPVSSSVHSNMQTGMLCNREEL